MVNLSEVSVVDTFKGFILDSLMKDKFIRKQEGGENFFSRNKKLLITTAAVIGGAVLAPVAISGVVAALGFGEAGIVAGSVAAWMMSLHRGYVAAGSLVAILQSIGAAGLGIGAIIASSFGGGVFAGAIAKALLIILGSNPEELADMEDHYVSITDDDDDGDDGPPTKVIFNMKSQLLDGRDENKKLKSFLKGFDLAVQIVKDRTKKFEFLNDTNDEKFREAFNFLQTNLTNKYVDDTIDVNERGFCLSLNN